MPSINDAKCVLITGATSGIGRALAESILALPSKPKVIAVGRRQDRLDELAKLDSLRVEAVRFNVDCDTASLKGFADDVISKYPEVDAVIFSAGVQHEFDFTKPEEVKLDILFSELNINLTSVITLINFFLPHFLKHEAAGRPSFIIPITSGLAIVPAAWVLNYCATKTALHSYCMSLQAQFSGRNVHIIELMPPLVESELHDHQGLSEALSTSWMPLHVYTDLAMARLKAGHSIITAGQSEISYQRFEAGKQELVEDLLAQRKRM